MEKVHTQVIIVDHLNEVVKEDRGGCHQNAAENGRIILH